MCLSIPMRIVELETESDTAVVERYGRRERVSMLLIGPQPVGTWVLTALGFAREVVDEAALVLIEEALAALAASLDGGYEADAYFRDLSVADRPLT